MINCASEDIVFYDPMGSSHSEDVKTIANDIVPLLPAPTKRRRYYVHPYNADLGIQLDNYNCGLFVLVACEIYCGASSPGPNERALLQYLRYRYLCMCLLV
jgi:hypothetical protein